MNDSDNAMVKRSILLGARIRFSPSGAGIRTQAIERIIEQNLAADEAVYGLTLQQLQDLITLGGHVSVLRVTDVREGLDSLLRSKRVVELHDGGEKLYILSDQNKKEVSQLEQETEKRIKAIIHDLFGSAPGSEESYSRAFLKLLCIVFSKLSDAYIQVIAKRESPEEFSERHLLTASLEDVVKSESVANPEAFSYGVNRFFRESSPDFDKIKWNMTQNFYVVKALGIDARSDLLSADLFKSASLFCDTNILIAGLTPEDRHYKSFQELIKACKSFGIVMKSAHITVVELKQVINYQAELLSKVIDRIPKDTWPKVSNFFFEAYLAEKKRNPGISLGIFIEGFIERIKTLKNEFAIGDEDDEWFDSNLDDQKTIDLAWDLSKEYLKTRGRYKSENAAIHDALLLLWVANENRENRKSWIVTLDVSLVKWARENMIEGIKVITLDAFLQWMTPVALGALDEEGLADIFAQAIRYQLLPRDTFFQLRDFQVFADMEIETAQLPAEDVEACIREIQKNCINLDPSQSADREKIGRVIQRYFADPGTKFKRRIEELQIQSKNLVDELADEKLQRINARKRTEELEASSQEMSKQIESGRNALIDSQSRIEKLEKQIQENEKTKQHKRLVKSIVWRTILALGILTVVELIIGYLAWKFGEGPNLFQKLTKAWPWLGLGFACVALVYRFVLMGRDRMRLIKWLKGDTD